MVRDATARSLTGLFETTKTLVETTAGLFTYDLDFCSTLPSKVDSLTTSEVVPQFSWSVREETFVGAMVDLNGHEAGNGGQSQVKPTALRRPSTRRDAWLQH